MKKFLGIVVLGLLVCGLAQAASSLPECKGSNSKKWTNCQGNYINDDGSEYVGEFKDGKGHGQGALTYADGEKYVGEFKNDKRHGQGTLTFGDGTGTKAIFKKGEIVKELK